MKPSTFHSWSLHTSHLFSSQLDWFDEGEMEKPFMCQTFSFKTWLWKVSTDMIVSFPATIFQTPKGAPFNNIKFHFLDNIDRLCRAPSHDVFPLWISCFPFSKEGLHSA